MWPRDDGMLPIEGTATNNNNLCTKSLLDNLMGSRRIAANASSSSLEQHSNSSSLESIESTPILDGNRAVSTSCSEDSFEMSSISSKPATDTSHAQTQGLNRLSSVSNPGNTLKSPEAGSDSPNQKVTECCNSEQEQMSRDSLEPSSSSDKYDSLRLDTAGKTDSLASTSCNFDSFERQNDAVEFSENTQEAMNKDLNCEKTGPSKSWPVRHGTPSTSKSSNEITNIGNAMKNRASVRDYIDKELNDLDTCLPELDFNKLEEKLNCAAKERMMTERKLLGEQVRRRLALQVDQYTAGPAPRIYTRPSRSNLGFRLQTAMNLQVCYINDLKDEEDEESSDDELFVPKSKSAPNLRSAVLDGSNLNASELRQAAVSAVSKSSAVVFLVFQLSNFSFD
ncbi:unnamed protein product [Gongylonema pulchrum]|uniref:SCHIP-1 domain-containing protein n=1 Tax=Gongylonema pulchrum TaxID=637853 RepID=A0A183EIX2_9BILA|nr:unnamed protein product [Gongylonema pulchrum]